MIFHKPLPPPIPASELIAGMERLLSARHILTFYPFGEITCIELGKSDGDGNVTKVGRYTALTTAGAISDMLRSNP